MRTSLIEIQEIEQLLLAEGHPEDRLLTCAKAYADPQLADKINRQRQVMIVARQYGREKLQAEIRQIDCELFGAPRHRSFQHWIRHIFQKQ